MADRLTVEVRGDREVQRALARLPPSALRIAKDGAEQFAREMANAIRAAGRARGRQSGRASRTVRTARSVWPKVVGGPHPFFMGSEFGAHRRFGWYAHPRYRRSVRKQYPPRQGGNPGYWFTPTQRAFTPRIRVAHQAMADAVIRGWDA